MVLRTLFPVRETICWDGMKNLGFFPVSTPSTFRMDLRILSGRVEGFQSQWDPRL